MYKVILVPVAPDHRDTTAQALAVARALADPGATITALTVLEPIPPMVDAELGEDLEARREPLAAEALNREVAGTEAKPVVITGHAGRTIVDYATEHGADCIVVASHKPGLVDYFLGSTAARVVRHAPCAVHVVR